MTLLGSGIDGWVENAGPSHDYGKESERGAKLQMRWNPSAVFRLDYFLDYGTLDSTPPYFQNSSLNGLVIDGYTYYADPSGPSKVTYRPIDLPLSTSRFVGQGLTLSWNINDALTVKSLTGYRTLDFNAYQDYADVFTLAPLFPYGLNVRDQISTYQFTQEFQLTGATTDHSLSYTAGLYYFRESGNHLNTVGLPDFFLTDTNLVYALAKSKAVYGQLTWAPELFGQRLEITPGARYTWDDRSGERFQTVNGIITENGVASGAVGDASYSKFTPGLTFNYHWTPDLATYLKGTTGYRAGGFYEAAPPGDFGDAFAPETITSFEGGAKWNSANHHFRANVAAFTNRFKDIQLTIQSNPADPSQSLIYNAGRATISGVELDTSAIVTQRLTATFSYAYLNATIDRVDVVPGSVYDQSANPASPYHVGDNISRLFVMPYAPRHSFIFGADYMITHIGSGALTAHADYRWQDLVYGQAVMGPDVPNRQLGAIPAYGVLNGRLTFETPLADRSRLRISVWGQNITDKHYILVNGVNGSQFPIESGGVTVPAGFTSSTIAWAEPATYGIELQYLY
jgi:iron complex outermembrane receptor protein